MEDSIKKYFLSTSNTIVEDMIYNDLQCCVDILLEKIPTSSSIILVGGYSRNEGSVWKNEGEEVPANDYDLVVIYSGRLDLNKQEFQLELCKKLHVDLIDISFIKENKIKRLPYTMFCVDLLQTGKILWGEDSIFKHSNKYPLTKLPLLEGRKLLFNRMVDFFEIYFIEDQYKSAHYLAKCIFSCIDAVLISRGMYTPYYSGKVSLLKQINGFNKLKEAGDLALMCKLYSSYESLKDKTRYWLFTRELMQGAILNLCERLYNHKFEDLYSLAKYYPRSFPTFPRRVGALVINRNLIYEKTISLETDELCLLESASAVNLIWEDLCKATIKQWYELKH